MNTQSIYCNMRAVSYEIRALSIQIEIIARKMKGEPDTDLLQREAIEMHTLAHEMFQDADTYTGAA